VQVQVQWVEAQAQLAQVQAQRVEVQAEWAQVQAQVGRQEAEVQMVVIQEEEGRTCNQVVTRSRQKTCQVVR
jgi:hypothetical protein